jgi:hypothetical protein
MKRRIGETGKERIKTQESRTKKKRERMPFSMMDKEYGLEFGIWNLRFACNLVLVIWDFIW